MQSSLRELKALANSTLEEAQSKARNRQIAIFLLFTGLSTAYGLAVSIGFRRRILKPLRELGQTIDGIRRGDNLRVPVGNDDEIGTVCSEFNTLLQEQAENHLELDRHRLHLKELLIGRTRDLSQANAELALARDSAEASNLAKSSFLANMSHEIRSAIASTRSTMRRSTCSV